MELQVKLPVFEGPLDLLLHLIEKNKLDIYDIPILEITKQYLETLESWDAMNMEVASEFIVMAATLISIKARHLLPSAEEEEEEAEDEEKELIQRLLLYKKFKDAAALMRPMMRKDEEGIFFRSPEVIRGKKPLPKPEELLKDLDLSALLELYQRQLLLLKNSVNDRALDRSRMKRESYSVSDKIKHLKKTLLLFETISFYDLRKKSHSKEETITIFMAMLELSRMNEIVMTQDTLFGDIIVKTKTEEEKKIGETLPETGD